MRGSSALKANTDALIEISRNELTGVAHLTRQKDAPSGATLTFTAIPVRISRLADTGLDTSLVCVWNDASNTPTSQTPIMKMREISLLRQAAGKIGNGNTISVRQVLIALGKSDTAHFKAQLADALPLDQDVRVDMLDGTTAILRRAAKSGYGDITCSISD